MNRPINEGVERRESTKSTLEQFVELVYLPVYLRKWKPSTAETEIPRIKFHLVRPLGERLIRSITREELQDLLDRTVRFAVGA